MPILKNVDRGQLDRRRDDLEVEIVSQQRQCGDVAIASVCLAKIGAGEDRDPAFPTRQQWRGPAMRDTMTDYKATVEYAEAQDRGRRETINL